MDVRERILQAAAELLSGSPVADVSTRAVCEAAGVAAPALYRQFGDKDGLLAAVVDHGFERYLAAKRALPETGDPVRDLRDGWDNHVAFALEHPNYYRLMWAPGLTVQPEAAAEAHRLLEALLTRVARAGRLRVPVPAAARMMMSATVGVALSLLARPTLYREKIVSDQVRDALLDAVLTDQRDPPGSVAALAVGLDAELRAAPPAALTASETALLQEWLTRIADDRR